jgi:outer membrane protein TolC
MATKPAAPAAAALAPGSAPGAEEPELTFADAYDKILQRSLRVQTQDAQIRVAEGRRMRAVGMFAPGVSATTTNIQDPTTWGRQTAYLTAKLNVFKGGSDVEALKGAREQVAREREQLEVEHQNAEAEATLALVDAIGQTLLRDIAAQLAASTAEINQTARRRFEKGQIQAQEVEKAKIELDNARARLNDAETTLARARAILRTLLGQGRVRPEWPWKGAIARDGTPGSGLADAPFDMQKRPDWRAATRQYEADRRRANQTWRQLWPSLDLQASYGTEDASDPGRRDWSVTFALSTQLFDQGQTIGLAQERDAIAQQAAYLKEGIERRADADIEIDRQAHRIAARSALARQTNLTASQGMLDDSEKRFRLGKASVNDLVIDQTRFSDSERLAIDGWSQAHISLLRLCHVLGGRVEAGGDCRRP